MRRYSAFTIAEVLVVAFLGVVVLGLMMQLLMPSLWMFRVESARSDAQQGALMAAIRLQQALMNSQMESIYIGEDPVSICFQDAVESNQPFDPASGAAVMTNYFRIYWYDAINKRLMMKVWPPGPPANNLASLKMMYDFSQPSLPQRILYQQDLQEIISQVNGSEQVMARNVERVYLTDYGNDADHNLDLLSPPIEITIECSVDTSMQGATTQETYVSSVKAFPRSIRY